MLALTAICLVVQSASALTFKTKNSSEHDDVQRRTPVEMQPSPIDGLTLPEEWPFRPANELSTTNRQHLSVELQADNFLSGGQADRCSEIGTSDPSPEQLASCISTVALEFYRSGSMTHFEPTLVNIAKTDPLTYVTKANDFSSDRYDARAVMTVYGAFYAYYYDFFNFDAETRQLVDSYFERKLTYLNMDAVGEYKEQRFCDPRKPNRIGVKSDGRADLNTCESNRWKATIAQLLLGMRLKNEMLFQRGIYNTKFMLLLFDDEGIFIPWATRGALAISYSNEVPRFLSKLTEIYHVLGYDFLEHELETGLRVKDLYKTYFNIYDNKDILNKYAERRYAEKGESYAQYQKRSTEEELRRWKLTKESFARESMRYIKRYRPDLEGLIACDFRLRDEDNEPQRLVSSFSAVDSYEFHLGTFAKGQESEEYCYQKIGAQRRADKIKAASVAARLEEKRAALEAKANALVEALMERGVIFDEGGWVVTDKTRYMPGEWELTETTQPDNPGKSTKYRFRIRGAGEVNNAELIRGRTTIYVSPKGHKKIGYDLNKLFRNRPALMDAWQKTTGTCSPFREGEEDWLEIPIQTDRQRPQEWLSCVIRESDEDGMLPVIRTLVFLGSHLEQSLN